MDNKNELNERQREAVSHRDGPALVIAGAGTGKTRVLTERMARLIRDGVSPERILAITFTNKAANEMRERVHALLRRKFIVEPSFADFQSPFIGTFHSLGVFILRRWGTIIGIKKNFLIKDREDSIKLIREAISHLGLDPKRYSAGKLCSVIGRKKGDCVELDDYFSRAGRHEFLESIGRVWELYDSMLKKENALDFEDLVSKAAFLLKTNAGVRDELGSRWQHLHIDEYQDTNVSQYTLARLLSETHRNIFVVGDGDQSIYGWRGAHMENIVRFEEDFPGASVYILEENYRSTNVILSAANKVIKKNSLRKEKNLFTKREGGEAITITVAEDEGHEARLVAERAQKLLESGIQSHQIAVLYRANFQSRALEEAFLSLNVPYRILGVRFFERQEVKDLVAYLRAAHNRESLGDIKRIINTPPRGIGKASIAKLFSGKQNELTASAHERVKQFFSLLEKIKNESTALSLRDLIAFVAKESGLHEYFQNEEEYGVERIENIKELASLASRYESLPKEERLHTFLNDIALASDGDAPENEKQGVRLMTIHAAKGLEFSHVFVVGLEEGIFPYAAPDGEEEKNEEERRLFYVALTRAKEKLHLSCAAHRTVFGLTSASIPSQFLSDIPDNVLEIESPAASSKKTIIFE